MKLANIRLIAPAALALALALTGAYMWGKAKRPHSPSDYEITVAAAVGQPGSRLDPSVESALRSDQATRNRPAGVAELIARAQAQLPAGGVSLLNPAMLRAMAPLTDLSASEVQTALEQVKSMSDPQQQLVFYSLLLGRWAELDGAAALAYSNEKLTAPLMQGIKHGVLQCWANHDPHGVWQWYRDTKQRAAGPGPQFALMPIFESLATHDLGAALGALRELNESERSIAITGLVQRAGDETYRNELLARTDAVEQEDTRRSFQRTLLAQWSVTDPTGALEWIETRPSGEQTDLTTSAAVVLMMKNSRQGAELVLAHSAPERMPEVRSIVANQWARHDPEAAAAWLADQPEVPDWDGARSAFATVVSHRDPQSALEWAMTVTDQETRQKTIDQIYATWRRSDPVAAHAAFNASGLLPAARK